MAAEQTKTAGHKKTTEVVEALLKDKIAELGFELCDVEFAKEYGNWELTLFINKDGGVDLNDCETVSRAVDPILDEADPIEQSYYLSVSSLGLDRPLKKTRDYERNMGNELIVKLFVPFEGKKEWIGILQEYDEESFTILTEDERLLTVTRKEAALVKPYLRF